MATEYTPIDISTAPPLNDLVDEVRHTNRPHVLRRANEDVAVIAPVQNATKRSPVRKKSEADVAAFLAAAGAGKMSIPIGSKPTSMRADGFLPSRAPIYELSS